jgi:hypothetical protein
MAACYSPPIPAATGIRERPRSISLPIKALPQFCVFPLNYLGIPHILPHCDNNVGMAKRECIECRGELVLAFRSTESRRFSPVEGNLPRSNANWRCSTCGRSYSAEQLRVEKRASAKLATQA